jgi:hypothetical protein
MAAGILTADYFFWGEKMKKQIIASLVAWVTMFAVGGYSNAAASKTFLDIESQTQQTEEYRILVKDNVRRYLGVLHGTTMNPHRNTGAIDSPVWLDKVRNGDPDPYTTICDNFVRYLYGVKLTELIKNIAKSNNILDSDITSVESVTRKVGLDVVRQLVSVMGNPRPFYCITPRRIGLSLNNPADVMNEIVRILGDLKAEPKDIGSSATGMRASLLKGLRVVVADFRKQGRLKEWGDAAGVTNGYIDDYKFTPQELGLTAEEVKVVFGRG